MILVQVNKLSYIIINHYKFLLLKILVVLHDQANKYCYCQFNAKTCNKCMLREKNCEDCQPVNEVFHRNRCVICHFKFALCDICKEYEKIGNEENLDKRQLILTISTLIVKFFHIQHCFENIGVDNAKFLFNRKNCRSCAFLFLKEAKTFIISNKLGI